jgi:uncharacterized protein
MLLSFTIKNYRSICDLKLDISFGERKAPNGYREMEVLPFIGNDHVRAVPCLALYGPNASGKTNIIKAFHTMQRIVKSKFIPGIYDPNKLQSSGHQTSYQIEFFKEDDTYNYLLVHDDLQLVEEKLEVNGNIVFSLREKQLACNLIASEVYTIEKLETILLVECLDQSKNYRTPFLSVLGKNYANLEAYITKTYVYLTEEMEIYKKNDFPFEYCMNRLATGKELINHQAAFEKIVSVLKNLDIDISRMQYSRKELESLPKGIDNTKYEYVHIGKDMIVETEIKSYHINADGDEVEFEFREESEGTRRLACLLGVILSVLHTGHVLIIDEMENSLHPLLLIELIRMFKDKRYNKHNAQLVFTTHNTDVMDHEFMRVSEIGIVSKNLKHGTMMKRISDFQGVRNVTRFRKQYLQGQFAGIPYPYI